MTDAQYNKDRIDAMTCYILSQRQGVPMIAKLMAKSEEEVERLIKEGQRIFKERQRRRAGKRR